MSELIRRVAALAAAVVATIALSGCDRLDRAAGVPVYYASHQLCSAIFVAGLDPGRFYREAIAPEIAPVSSLIHYDIDRAHRAVTASLAGIIYSRAVYRGPLGCQVEHRAEEPQPQPDIALASPAPAPAPAAPPLLPPIAGPDVVEPADPALKAALDRTFADGGTRGRRGCADSGLSHRKPAGRATADESCVLDMPEWAWMGVMPIDDIPSINAIGLAATVPEPDRPDGPVVAPRGRRPSAPVRVDRGDVVAVDPSGPSTGAAAPERPRRVAVSG
jgi:hypothetical protein